jgi:hypothetical protein
MEIAQSREPWNKGKLIGQKPPLKLKDIWAIDSKLRGCDLATYGSGTFLTATRC